MSTKRNKSKIGTSSEERFGSGVKYMPGMCKVLSIILSTAKRINKR
jgi:hypothetical protein